jgi:sarcosine oxidase subunit gamma
VEPETRDLETALFKLLQGLDTAVVDLSHARAVIRLSGEAARQVLSKGSGVDFHRNSFRSGDVAQTALFHVSALIDCVDNVPTCDLFVPRGFALAFWQHLRHACAEYGYSVV